MKLSSILNVPSMRWTAFLFHIILITNLVTKSYAQTKNYATTATVIASQVDSPNEATNGTNNFATVKSRGGTLGFGKYSGELELKFPVVLPANTTTFIRIDSDPDILNALLGGNLGGLLANVLGNVVLGDHVFEIGARRANGTNILSGTSSVGFTSPNLRLIKDAAGLFYMVVTPNEAYDKVYVKDVTNSLLLGAPNETKVYNAFYFTGSESCATGYATGYEGSGLTVDVIGLGKAGVTNPERAIDADQTNFSEISLGALGVAGSISQNIYFTTLSAPGDEFNVRLRINPALISAGLLNNTFVTAYNGNTEVFSQSLNSLLSLDLLGLLNAGAITNVPFKPALQFDRVKITLNSLLNVGLTQTVNLYSIYSSAPRPTFTAPQSNVINVCFNTTATLGATTATENELRWYELIDGGIALATTAANVGYTTTALTANKTYYVAARRIGCTAESVRVPVSVIVNPQLLFASTTLTNGSVGSAYVKQINVATGGTQTYSYTLANGSLLPNGLMLSTNGQIGGTPTVAGDYTFTITATDSKNCSTSSTFNLKITSTFLLPSLALPNGTVGTLYPTQVIPSPTGGSTPYTYVATNLPPGLTFDPITREITGTPTQAGPYVVNVVATDADGNQASNNYTIVVKDPLTLAITPLAEGTVGVGYLTQTIPSAAGGTISYTYVATNLPPGLTFNQTTREITGTPLTSGNYIIPVTVTDNEGRTTTVNYTIRVLDPLTLPGQALPDGNVSIVYPTQTLPSASGGVGPYTYATTNLPAGLTFNPTNRQLSGTPTQAGNYTITLTATDADLRTISNTYALKVIGTLNLPTATLANGIVGSTYPTQTLPAVTGGTAPYTYVAINLPPGLGFNTATREITGTPTQGGTYTVTLTATDAIGNVVSTDYNIVINVPAPTVANATVCSGTMATLTVSNLQAGVTYNWYGATGNTALATSNNGTFITPAITANTTFYVEAVSGTALSTRTSVTVNINPAPNPPVIITSNQTINNGQSTVLQATANAGEIINWYANAAGGISLGTGPSFTTPNLVATTTYYAGTVNADGCASLSRSPVTVTVLNGSTSPNCNFANSQNSGINGLCILCSITNPLNSTDADLTNFTRITLAVGVGAQGYQRLIFPNAGLATDSIRLDLATPTGLLDLNVLSGVTITVMNNGTVVNSYQLNSALIDLKLLSGNRFKATFLAGNVYDRVEVRFGATVAALNSIDIYGAEIIYPKPTVASTGLNICAGNTTTLTATPNGATTLTWYSTALGGIVLANGTSYTTPVLTTNTTYYIEVSKAGCANTERVPVTVIVTPILATPVIAVAAAVCSGSSTLLNVSNPDPAITYNWFEAAAGGTSIFTGTSFTTPALTVNKTYYVEATQSGCVSTTRGLVDVTVNPRPSAPQVQASSSTINQGQTAVINASSADANVIFNWYVAANSSTPFFTGSTYVTPPLNATTSYYVESVSNITSCASSSRVQVTITVNPAGTANPVPCEGATAQTNSVTGVLTILAGVSNPSLAIDDDTQTASTLVIPVGLAGSVFQNLSFPSASTIGDTVRILISSPSKLLSAAVLRSLQLTSYNAGVSNGDAVFADNTVINLSLLSGNTQALLTFVPAASFDAIEVRLNSGLLGALTSLNVNYAQHVIAKPQVAAANVAVCVGQAATLTVSNFNPAYTYKWYDAAGVLQATTNVASYNTVTLNTSTKYSVSAVSTTGCESAKTDINIIINPLPVLPELLFADVNTCTGNNVLLAIKNPVLGTTYKWYNSVGTYQAGLDGVTFNVPAVIANTTYSVEAINACGTSARATATITVGATVDAPIVTPMSVTISEGSPAVLTASSSTNGAVFNWYDTSNSATIIFTGANFVTPALSMSRSYFVEAIVPGPCPASARTEVKINVIPNGTPISAPCGAATVAIADGVSGAALLASVANPSLAIDNDTNTGSSLLMPVGSLGAYVYQRVGFTGGLSRVGDTLRVKLSSPGKLLSLALLPSISVVTYNGLTSNADVTIINNPSIQLNLLSDGSSLTLSYVPTQTFDGVEIRLNSGLIGALTSVNFDYAQRINLAPQVTNATVSACQGTVATLGVANPQAGVIYRWYLDNTFQSEGSTFNTPTSLVPGTYNYNVRVFRFGCESAATKVSVNILSLPTPPTAVAATVSSCFGSPAVLNVQSVAGVNINWYDAGGNLLVLNNTSYTTSASLAAGTYDFFAEAVNGGNCVNSSRTKITLTVKPLSIAADIQVAGSTLICGSSTAKLTASSATVTNPVFTWYSNANLTNVVFVGNEFTTPVLTTSATYYVTVKGDNKCENSVAEAKAIIIIINPTATQTDINLAGVSTICSGSTVALTASSVTVINPIFTWYRNIALTDVAFVGAIFTTPALTTNTTYYVTVKGDNKCENTSGNAQVITINVNPTAIVTDLAVNGISTICKGSSTTLSASSTTVTNPVFTWYNDAALTSIAFTGANLQTPTLLANRTYYVTVNGDNKCESSSSSAKMVVVTVNDNADQTDITVANVIVCAGNQVTLNASSLTVTNPVFTWYSDASLTVTAHVGPTFLVQTLNSNTTYYVTVKGSNKCENTPANAKVVTVTVNALAGMTDIMVTGNATACAGSSAQLTASSPTVTNPIFSWYADAALTNLIFTGPTFSSSPLFLNTTFYVTVKGDNKCANAAGNAKIVPITVLAVATGDDVFANDATICEGTKATLIASTTTVTNPIFIWYTDASLSNVAFIGSSFTTPNLAVTTKYYLTVKGINRCENTTSTAKIVTVNVNGGAKATDINLSTPAAVCGLGIVTINASSITVTNPIFTWYSDASLTVPVFVGPSFTTPSLATTTTYFVTVKGANKCENTAADAKSVTIDVRPIATSTDVIVGGNLNICSNNTTTLTASSATVTNPVFTWYTNVTLTTVAAVGASFTTPLLNANTIYYVTVKGDNKCENTPATARQVTVTVNTRPDNPLVSNGGRDICAGQITTLTVTNPQAGVAYEWYVLATGGSPIFTGTSFTTPILNANTTYYVQAVGAGGCGNSSGRLSVDITVTPRPAIPAVASSNVSVCTGNVAVLSVANASAGTSYNWYGNATGGTTIGTGANFTTPTITTNTTYYVEAVSGSCASTARTAVIVTALPVPLAPISVSASSSQICTGSTTMLTVNNPDATLDYRWYATSSFGTILAQGTSFTTPVLNVTTTYYVESIAKAGGCSSTSRTSITINLLPVLEAPKPTVASNSGTSITFAWNPVTGATGYEVSINNGTTWTNPSSGTNGNIHIVTGLQPGQTITLLVRATGSLNCQMSASTSVNGTTNNPFANELFIPNTFTPNGDGKNDIFLAYGNTVASFRMRIYNQWGEYMFESNQLSKGWDGSWKGNMQPTGVYVYQMEATFNDGTTKSFKGTVTLLR